MRIFFHLLLAATMCVSMPVMACSPSFDYINRPLAMKLQGDKFFIGRVTDITATDIVFEVITAGGPTIDKRPGDTATFKRGNHGTCGSLNIQKGDTWLYDGSDISFSPSVKLQYTDTKDGYDLDSVKKNVVARLDPKYVAPHKPAKSDLPVTGVYSHTADCAEGDKLRGFTQSSYVLKIGSPHPQTGKYSVDITVKNCRDGQTCGFRGSAPPYGYGEIIVPFAPAADQHPKDCSLIIQQISSPDEWPKLQKGQSIVKMNNSHCKPVLSGCTSIVSLDSPVLQK